MRKEYGKALRAEFSKQLKKHAPEFEAVSIKSMYLGSGEKVFRWVPSEPNHCFIILVPHHKIDNEFMVELGWSREARFPELSMRPCSERPIRGEEFSLPEYVCRLPHLYSKSDITWVIGKSINHPMNSVDSLLQSLAQTMQPISAEKAEAEVKVALENVFKYLTEHGLPYLREWASQAES